MLNYLLQQATQAQAAESGTKDIFGEMMGHLSPHKIEGIEPFGLPVFNLQVYQVAAVLCVLFFFGVVAAKMSKGQELKGLWRVLGGWVLWIRNEMVFPIMGKERGSKYLPFFLSIFFFIMFCNLFGLLGSPLGGTATASIFVTGALAVITLMAVLVLGMYEQGVIAFWKHLIPSGIPLALLPIMVPVEIIGLFTKHFALMVRLWANMTGGHLILAIFLGFIFMAGAGLGAAAYGLVVPVVGFSVFIMIIESFVALLQAYIFTLLSIIFVGAAVHPEH